MSTQINICDLYEDRSIHCRNTCGEIPAGTHRIFTTNLQPYELFNLAGEQGKAVARRLICWELTYNELDEIIEVQEVKV